MLQVEIIFRFWNITGITIVGCVFVAVVQHADVNSFTLLGVDCFFVKYLFIYLYRFRLLV